MEAKRFLMELQVWKCLSANVCPFPCVHTAGKGAVLARVEGSCEPLCLAGGSRGWDPNAAIASGSTLPSGCVRESHDDLYHWSMYTG